MQPLLDLGTLRVAGLFSLRRRHLPAAHHLGNPLPDLHLRANASQRIGCRKVHIPFCHAAGMALMTIPLEQRQHTLVSLR